MGQRKLAQRSKSNDVLIQKETLDLDMSLHHEKQIFPEFARLASSTKLRELKGAMAVSLARIIGKGKTHAIGMNLPPSPIERQEALANFRFPLGFEITPALKMEIEDANSAVATVEKKLRTPELKRRFALKTLQALQKKSSVSTGNKDNQFFAGRFILVPDKNGKNWAWSMTPHYPIISKIPADSEYIVEAYYNSLEIVKKWTMPTEEFVSKLTLAINIANSFSEGENTKISDVARFFKIAVQSKKFWLNPTRSKFEEIPEAVFISNLINWYRNQKSSENNGFKLIPATLDQAFGPNTTPYYIPANSEGTSVNPMIYIQKQSRAREKHELKNFTK